MKRVLTPVLLVLPLLMIPTPSTADVKTRDKTQVKFEGMLGRMMGLFGGRAAKDGVVVTNAVRGDLKIELNDSTGRIVDLGEEKVYTLDMKRKTYEVKTFEELRRELREAQEKAEREAPKEEERRDEPAQEQAKDEKPEREYEVDFDVKETGATKKLAGYDTREVVMTITVREKGRTLEESGGMVMTSNAWMGPDIPAMKELADFEMRYWKAITPEAEGMSAEQMAAILAMYPMLKSAMERQRTESASLQGTPLATTTVFEAVKSKEQLAQSSQQQQGGGGLGGMLARRMMKRDEKPRATILTITHETLEVTPDVAPGELQIPEGFKQKS